MYLKVKYFDKDMPKIEKTQKGDWIDLRAAAEIHLNPGDFALIPLGVAIQLPEGCEAILAPRSSTFKNYGIMQTNSIGIIDETYCGDNDQWMMPVYATRGTVIKKYDRICQFRLFHHMDSLVVEFVDHLSNADRGGFGSTGKR